MLQLWGAGGGRTKKPSSLLGLTVAIRKVVSCKFSCRKGVRLKELMARSEVLGHCFVLRSAGSEEVKGHVNGPLLGTLEEEEVGYRR